MLLVAIALAAPEGPAVPPPHRLLRWGEEVRVEGEGTRVAMIVEAIDAGSVRVEVNAGGGWLPLEERWHEGRVSVLRADLGAPAEALGFRSPHVGRITLVEWDLFTPTAGEPRADSEAPPPALGVLPAALQDIGVIARADWGADATTCTSTEDDWYRMAIHHTAGSQTYGGTVQGAVQALQAYALSTGEYCDIPYQFLVGYDGSLWEGRPYDYYSGATGGGNNDGNAAVCFLGCYHPSDCSTSHSVTEAMMESGQILVQTVASLNEIPSTEDSIRGHRDWPDNATACPGDWLHARLDELRTPLEPPGPSYAGSPTRLVCAPGEGASLSLAPGETGACTLTVLNTGSATWSPGVTTLAPIPRDEASPLAAPSWINAERMVTVSASTSPGATGDFAFDVLAPTNGNYSLSMGLLEEGVVWFAEDGGPADGAITVSVRVSTPAALPGEPVPLSEAAGCGCGTGGQSGAVAALLGLGLLSLRVGRSGRRKDQDAPAA